MNQRNITAARQHVLRGLAIIAIFTSTTCLAQNDDPAAPPPIPPIDAPDRPVESLDEGVPIPPKVQDEDSRLEPTVDIRRDEDDNLVEEYRMDGQVYMVKVTPKNGIPYYYIDDDGDGRLELRESDRSAHPVKPVYWKIKEWH